jgi:predicted negative regulator of RcsB-dependent stress response
MSAFLNTSVIVLATMVIALAGMVGYIYFQQNKLLNAVQGLSSFVSSQFVPPIEADEEDDRASVEEEKEVAEIEEEVEDGGWFAVADSHEDSALALLFSSSVESSLHVLDISESDPSSTVQLE